MLHARRGARSPHLCHSASASMQPDPGRKQQCSLGMQTCLRVRHFTNEEPGWTR